MKNVMITGSNVGLGKECARQLASVEGVEKVILACRNHDKAIAAKEDLERTTNKKIYEVLIMDICNLDSVRKAAASIEESCNIDGLVLNAGGMLRLDLTDDGVTTSFAGNVLGHVVLTMELIKTGKLSSGCVVLFSSSEAVRDIPELSAKRVKLNENSVEEFKQVADGSFMKARKSMSARGETYGVVKYMGTLWTSYMARQHPNMRFVSISPGATKGTKFFDDMPMAGKIIVKGVFNVFSLLGRVRGVEEGAKRYIDALTDHESFQTGGFYASKKGSSGPVAEQSEAIPSFEEYADIIIQENAAQAIHDIINQKDFVTKAKNQESKASL